jgi:hypothetical protein
MKRMWKSLINEREGLNAKCVTKVGRPMFNPEGGCRQGIGLVQTDAKLTTITNDIHFISKATLVKKLQQHRSLKIK